MRNLAESFRRLARTTRFRLSAEGRKPHAYCCPVCGYRGPFADLVQPQGVRLHARCPACRCLERHRLQALVLDGLDQRLFRNARILHLAPEPFLEQRFRTLSRRYIAADRFAGGVDCLANLEQLPFADESLDLVYASHVLEHVQDDRRAIAEIHRVLRPGGLAILPVPIQAQQTVEYGEARADEHHHVRAPGLDYYDRYRSVFERVDEVASGDFDPRYQLFALEPHEGRVRARRDLVPLCYKE